MKRYNSILNPRAHHRHKQKKVTQELIYKICDTLRHTGDPHSILSYPEFRSKYLNDLCRECEECGLIFDRNRVTEPNYLYEIARAALND